MKSINLIYLVLFLFIFLNFSCSHKVVDKNSIKYDTIYLSISFQGDVHLEDDYDIFLYNTGPNFPIDDESRFINGDTFGIALNPRGDYAQLKYAIRNQREAFKQKFLASENEQDKDKVIIEAGKYISETLVNKIFPFWYGMPWDLAGYSDIPNKGEVGCSYFVSNTMKHCGFKVNRYRLAQQNTKNIALSVQTNDSILIIEGKNDIYTIKNYFLENKKEGLYYVGLDSHVGYLLYKMGEVFFIQSNYADPVEVLIEYSEKSDVFLSDRYYIADITFNIPLIKKWLLNEEVRVVME